MVTTSHCLPISLSQPPCFTQASRFATLARNPLCAYNTTNLQQRLVIIHQSAATKAASTFPLSGKVSLGTQHPKCNYLHSNNETSNTNLVRLTEFYYD